MSSTARTPEELEALFEDALLVRDREAIQELFGPGAILVHGDVTPAYDGEDIVDKALAMWADGNCYIAHPDRILQSRDVAVVIAKSGVNVATRGQDGAWRYAIIVLTAEIEI